MANGLLDIVRNQDAFGQPVPLNYNGEDTYKTVFGGAATVAVIVFGIIYLLFQIEHVMSFSQVTLATQLVHLSEAELNSPMALSS